MNASLFSRSFCAILCLGVLRGGGWAGESASWLRPGDVIALVGGENWVAAADHGYLEYFLHRAQPEARYKFRSLAREGDTAFEQTRDFNYPGLATQLDQVGASVVLLQLGQMESLRGKEGAREFEAAVLNLIKSLQGEGSRRIVLIGPVPVRADTPVASRFADAFYAELLRGIAQQSEMKFFLPKRDAFTASDYRDALHLNEQGHRKFAAELAGALTGQSLRAEINRPEELRLLEAVRSKNELWFHYYRPQNWAFLEGDRTVQPASRDHRDPEKRWFPAEMKEWLPLIAAQEQEIWRLSGRPPSR